MSTVVSNTNAAPGEVRIPKTITPISVSGWNLAIFLAIGGIVCFFFGIFPAVVVTGLIIASSVYLGGITDEEVDYHGHLLLNSFSKKRRVIFPGLHQKLFWEKEEEGSQESLRRIVSSEGEENLPTNDPAENMKAHLTVHKRMNLCSEGMDKEAAENFIRFHSIDQKSLSTLVRKEIVKKFSAYYGNNEMEDLINADTVQKAVFAETKIEEKIAEMGKNYGISIGVVLDTSNPDEQTKNMKRTPAMAESLHSARHKLMEKGPKGEEPLTGEQALRVALLLDPNSDYNERRIDLNVTAPDLKGVRDITVLGGLGGDEKKGGKK